MLMLNQTSRKDKLMKVRNVWTVEAAHPHVMLGGMVDELNHLMVKSLTIDALALEAPRAATPAEPAFFSNSFQNFKLSSAAVEC